MDNEGFLCCEVNVQWANKQGIIQRKLTNKRANLRILRGNSQIVVEIVAEKAAPVKFKVGKDVQVHNKFMREGKSSIKFPDENATLFLSNAPPEQLRSFLKYVLWELVIWAWFYVYLTARGVTKKLLVWKPKKSGIITITSVLECYLSK